MHEIVGIHTGNPLGFGFADGDVSCLANAVVFGIGKDFDAFVLFDKLLEDLERVVGGVVIDSDKFPVFVCLGLNAFQAIGEKLSGVINGHDDGDEWLFTVFTCHIQKYPLATIRWLADS